MASADPPVSERDCLIHDGWLSQRLSRGAYKLVVDPARVASSVATLTQRLKALQDRPVFVYAKVSTIALDAVRFLESAGFALIDTNVILEKRTDSAGKCEDRPDVTWATGDDRAEVVQLAARAFEYSRFHLDPALDVFTANRIKADWVDSFFAGNRGDRMTIARVEGVVAGFLLLIDGPAEGVTVDLIAVDKAYRRRGIARDMMAFAEARSGEGRRWRTGTQLANVPAIRFYEDLGYRVSEAYYVFHLHHM